MTPTLCLQYVPRRARRFVADSYNRLLKGINAVPNCIHSHAKLLLFVPFVLAVKIEKKVKQCRQVKDRALQYSKLELHDIVGHIVQESQLRPTRNSSETAIKPSIKTVKKLISLGRYSDAMKILMSDGVHPSSPSVIQSLKDKHPTSEPFTRSPHVYQNVSFKAEQVLQAINSFQSGSSGGPFALVERILKDLRLFKGYDQLYPKVKDFCENYLYLEKANLEDEQVIKNLSEVEARRTIEETFKKWTPRYTYELIPIETPDQPQHYNPYLIAE
jgi:hypothetical protein